MAWGPILRGWALIEQGQIEEGIAEERQGLEAYSATGSMLAQPYFLVLLAEAYSKGGQAEKGLAVLNETLSILDKTGERWWEAELNRLRGELLLAVSPQDYRQAEACFQRGIEIARRQGAMSLELRTAMSLGRLWQKKKQAKEAKRLLAEVYAKFTEGFDSPGLKEAERLLHDLS